MSAPKRGSRPNVLDSRLGQYPACSSLQAPGQRLGTSGILVPADFSIKKRKLLAYPSTSRLSSTSLGCSGTPESLPPACCGTSSPFLLPDGSAVEGSRPLIWGPSSCPSAAHALSSCWFRVLSGCLIRKPAEADESDGTPSLMQL